MQKKTKLCGHWDCYVVATTWSCSCYYKTTNYQKILAGPRPNSTIGHNSPVGTLCPQGATW